MAATATLPGALRGRGVPARPNKWVVSASILFGGMMGAIDTSVVNVSLAHIKATYGVTTQEVTWVSTSYLITLVIIMPLTAWVASVLGRKRMFMLSITIFTIASALCGMSRTLSELIAFRVLQGIGGGALQPVSQAIMRETFPPNEQAQAMGMFAMIGMLGPALGPSLGGWITDNLSWPFIFFVNIPIGIIGLFMASLFIIDPPYMRAQGIRRIDGVGIGLMAVGLASLQILLEQGETDGWFGSPFIMTLVIVSVVALTVFVLWELRVKDPVVDLRVLRNASFASGTIVIGVLGLALWGGMILMPLFFQQLLGYSATQAGVTLIPRSLSMLLMMPIAGMLYNRLGVYIMLPCGLLLSGGAGLMMAQFNLNTSEVQILVPQLLQGIGFSLMFVSLSTSSLSTIPRPQMQNATGMYNLVRQLGGSLGTAIVITLVDHKVVTASANLMKYASIYNQQFMQWWKLLQAGFIAHGSDATTAHMQALATLQAWITQQAYVVAYDYAFGVIGIVFFACLPLVLFMRRGQRVSASDVASAE
ncbi:MAG TPA: DHA2 family efflux MFS transporter permease subunit [bacterium]|nr:DHA2 family efflux MFS transporter permease subunit [bacterium]